MELLSRSSKTAPAKPNNRMRDEQADPPIDLETQAITESNTRHLIPDTERRVIRKMDMRIVPLVTALYVLAFSDRSNIGNARIAGMTKDLDLAGDDYQWLLTIFYIAYVIFEFQTLMWKVVPPHMWLVFVILSWGIVATAQSGTTSWSGMMACRFFLGWG